MIPSPVIVTAAQASMKQWGPFASIDIAQFGLESGWGSKVTGAFNYFGIKANAAQIAAKQFTMCMTHEFLNGHYVLEPQPFANYASPTDAFLAHAELLATHPAYAPLMERVKAGDVQGACNALTGVYATAPGYGAMLWTLICDDHLTQYDVEPAS
jgi:flagellum-specific peptidoglycan hydrolase FlgJ